MLDSDTQEKDNQQVQQLLKETDVKYTDQ